MAANFHQVCFIFVVVADDSRLQQIVSRYSVNHNPSLK